MSHAEPYYKDKVLTSLVVTIRTTRFSIRELYFPPIQHIYVFYVDLRTNTDYFPIRH
jgi:hypothetical protein